MPTLTKLFEIRIVLNSLSGVLISFNTAVDLLDLLLDRSSIFAGLSEKKATSEPEIRAEKINNIRSTANPTIIVTGGILAIMLLIRKKG